MRISTVGAEALMLVAGVRGQRRTSRGATGLSSASGGIVEGLGGDETDEPTEPKQRQRRYATKLAHPGYVVEVCPACGFPESDGGACEDCGWFRYDDCTWCRRHIG